MTDLPFKAHYTDDAGDVQCRAFATNAEAREFRATLVDGRLPKGDNGEADAEDASESKSEPVKAPDPVDPPAKPAITPPASASGTVLSGPKVEPSATGGNG